MISHCLKIFKYSWNGWILRVKGSNRQKRAAAQKNWVDGGEGGVLPCKMLDRRKLGLPFLQ